MAYDAESFKAGLAVGRMLWRPPMQDTVVIPNANLAPLNAIMGNHPSMDETEGADQQSGEDA